MRVRDLQWKGLPIWPPEWVEILESRGVGEEGFLLGVRLRRLHNSAYLSLEVGCQGSTRLGVILLEEPAHFLALHDKLQKNIGKPLAEIGNLEMEVHPARKGGQIWAYPK
jgi:hypothetical protein